jgi:hypothetical protein
MVSCLVLRHERRFVRAFFRFDAASVVVAHERLFAHATRCAHALHAFGRMFERAAGQAVQLRAAFVVDFVFGRAFLDGNGNWGGFVFAFVMLNTFAVVVAQKAFAAEAGWNALFRADGAGIGILARRSASRTARVEKFVGRAFLAFDGDVDGRDGRGLRALMLKNAFAFGVTYVAFFARAAGAAHSQRDAFAQWRRVFARSVAQVTVRHHFVFAANRRRQRGGYGDYGGFVFAFVMLNAFAVVVAQKAFATEAGWNALFRADGAGIGILARRSASRTARVEKFFGRAFRGLRFAHGNRYHGAIVRWDAGSEVVSQETFLAKAADDALFGAHGTRSRVFAGRSARGTARMVDFVGRALDGFRHFHGNRFH